MKTFLFLAAMFCLIFGAFVFNTYMNGVWHQRYENARRMECEKHSGKYEIRDTEFPVCIVH